MLYNFLRIVFSYATRKYFVKIKILNEENLPLDKPVLLLPNHRSAFMDPVVVATLIKRTTYFLVRGESFTNPWVVKIYNRLKMIPIFRKEHNPEKTHQNEDIFRYCYQLMEQKGCLMIFPEGVCQTKYLLAPVKTGAARIAIHAEEENDFELDIHVVPLGINYSNPHRFRGNLTLNLGKPILVSDYKAQFKRDARNAIGRLTTDIENALKGLIITVEDQRQMELVHQVEAIVSAGESESNRDWFGARRSASEVISHLALKHQNKYVEFKHKVEQYVGARTRLGIDKKNAPYRETGFGLKGNVWQRMIPLLLGVPLFFLGFALHIWPFLLTRILALRIVKRVDFMGSVALALGSLMFIVFGVIESTLFYHWTTNIWLTAAFIMAWPSLGLFSYGYLAEFVKWRTDVKWMRLSVRRRPFIAQLNADKAEILDEFRHLQEVYEKENQRVSGTTSN